jgi:hypothetical protein
VRPPPSPWVETFVTLLVFIAPDGGFSYPACVSAGGLCLAEGPVCGFVSAPKISVPRFSGDEFDDWVVGPQFEPYYLHHPVSRARTWLGAIALFPRNAGFLPLLRISVSVSGAGNAGFWEPVSALEISVPRSVGDRFMTGWWVPSSSYTVSTIQMTERIS